MKKVSLFLPLLQRFPRHPEAKFQAYWNWIHLGWFCLPFSPLLGCASILLTAIVFCKQQFAQVRHRPLTWGLTVLGLWLLLLSGFAVSPAAALGGLFNFVPLFVVFTAVSVLVRSPVQLRQLSWSLMLAAIPIVLVGLGQQFWGWSGYPRILWILLDLRVDAGGNPPGRMASIFAYANVLAGYLSMVFILGVGLWLDSGRSLRHQPHPMAVLSEKGFRQGIQTPAAQAWLRWGFLSLLLVAILICLVFTNSRNAWGVTVLSALAFALYQGWYWLTAGVMVMTGAVLGAAWGPLPLRQGLRPLIPAFFWARISDELFPDRPVGELRVSQWHFAWSLAQQRPLTGWGLRSFSGLYQTATGAWLGHPHNLWLMLSAETGIPATLLLTGLVGWILFQGVQLLGSWGQKSVGFPFDPRDRIIFFSYLIAFAACTLSSLVDVTLFDIRVNGLGWVILAGICGLVYRYQEESSKAESSVTE